MVSQPRWCDMDEATRARALAAVDRLANWVDSDAPNRKRPGVLVLRDEAGKRRRLYRHQVAAVNRLLTKGGAKTPWNERNASLLAVHEMGTGKTITAILALAVVHQIAPPHVPRRSLVVCPLSVLRVWEDTLRSWTTFGETILVADKQASLTADALESASVVVVTPDVLQSAFKSMWELDPTSKARRKMDRYRRIAGAPMHPLFALCATPNAFRLAVVDELHKYCKDSTIAGRAIRTLCKGATFKLGLTGTPVTARPQQLAFLAQVLNAEPKWLQCSGAFVAKRVPGARGTTGEGSIDRKSFEAFHAELVDRVGPEALDLPPKRHVTIEFDPHVGFSGVGDARFDTGASHAHNAMLNEAQTVVGDARRGGKLAQAFGEAERATWRCFVACSNYEYHATLGRHGAAAFKAKPELYDACVAEPSQYMELVERVVASRQRAGHARVAVFSESTTQLEVLRRFLRRERAANEGEGEGDEGCGEVFFYAGGLRSKARTALISAFLSCARGVLLISEAGAIGTTICPGCEVMLCIGTTPWNSATLEQAHGRIYRIGQDMPVEIIQLVPRRGVTVAKLALHADKRERLARAAKDLDYGAFEETDKQKWRNQCAILDSLRPLDALGNFAVAEAERAAAAAWAHAFERQDANGGKRPPPPRNLPAPPKRARRVPLPEPLPVG